MNKWFTVKIRYVKQFDNGSLRRVTEIYLVAAVTFSDAEARIYEELGTIIKGEFHVTNITPMEIHDIFLYDDADTFFRVKVSYDNFDSDTEKTKKVVNTMLVTANSTKQAVERIQESLKTLLVDYTIPEVKESKIVDIFPFNEEKT